MLEILQNYGDQIATIITVVVMTIVSVKNRTLSDQNILTQFESVKLLSDKINNKSWDLGTAIASVDQFVKSVNQDVATLQNMVDIKFNDIDQTLSDFKNDELYKNIQDALNKVDDLYTIIKEQDRTIAFLGDVIKEIRKKLG